ncbi:Eco57I restriction-modification methylase domain-containing protein [Chlorobium phaeovibrioides]|uniref:Eco57I restriction-modification methylase domain-containing protein n=1 Tax=Chlorobium phaeovibrioides TaxID=1094 RepID=UPI0021ADDE37|nr:DNA methyltransferase [Chlorobium phaeovibrioides]
MIYPSIRIEGAILSPDILEKLEEIPGQRSVDFGLDPSVKVKDEIARAWADAQDYWRIFNRKLETLKKESPATTETRNLWVVPLLGLFGYQLEFEAKSIELNAKLYPISHRIPNRGGAAIHIIGSNELAGLDRKPEKAALRMSAHAMVQEYLNLTEQLYGVVTNGRVLRLLRDSSRLVKLTYLEFDLDRIFTDGLFADFAVLYRLLHVTRLPASCEAPEESLIEKYHQDSLDSGARIREGLSSAVEKTILSFANGFLSNTENAALLAAITSGQIKPTEYYHYLLRLIYRILFLMVIEERNLVYPQSPVAPRRDIYDTYYSLMRLRRLSEKRYLADRRHHDHWLALMATFHLFEDGGPGGNLGIAPLAGDLFRADAIGPLNQCALDNETLLHCLRSLSLYENQNTGQLIRVNYAALNVEEFGSVYEGLLEYEPVFLYNDNAIEFAFAKGDQRAATGSHYTPDDLVQPLIKHSLDYLIADKLKTTNPEEALLSLRVADISCGSGHILLAAARRIATELAIVRTGEEQPSPSAFRSAIRDVIRNCIYGVDLNPLAVELCKVALWLEAHIPGQPLNFLDHHIKCGNAIVGFAHREEMQKGVPDEAFVTMPGDDKEVVAELRKRNKAERIRQGKQVSFAFTPEIDQSFSLSLKQWHEIASLPERTPSEIEEKKRRYQEFATGKDSSLLRQIASIPIAQFYIEKTSGNRSSIITDDVYSQYLSGQQSPNEQATAMVQAIAERKNFFHWFLEFPEIIENGGFDCILGNPPYLGRKNLSSTYGYSFCTYAPWEYAPAGLSDLVAYFVRRIFDILRPGGFTSFITTNSIIDGDVRRDSLEQVISKGGSINFAVRGIKWPGKANLVVSLVGLHKGNWKGKYCLDGKVVSAISAYFEDNIDIGEPVIIHENEACVFQGSIFLGDGFLLTHEEANKIIATDPKNKEVIYPVINGKEVNNNPRQNPGRSIINFFDWNIDKAMEYHQPFQIIKEKVKPFRESQNRAKNRDIWWIYAEHRPGLTRKLTGIRHCMVAVWVSKYLNFSVQPVDIIFTNSLYVFTTDRWDLYSIVQSTIHEVWARKYSGSLETRLRYSPTDCFETYTFPEALWQVPNQILATTGEHYHEYRRALMLRLWLGLTDIYNLFHNRALTPAIVAKVSGKPDEAESGYAGILELRKIHQELDEAVLAAYTWSDLNLAHDFYEIETLPENDRVRYTISPEARKELLKRLLALNHHRAEEEKANTPVKAAKQGKGQGAKRKKSTQEGPGLFG